MRYVILVLVALLGSSSPAVAQVSIGIGLPHVSIGVNVPVYPEFVRVPDYPVYYAPGVESNFFFYDGMYWVYERDNWYASSWYNGPWAMVQPYYVPMFVLRVPVRYYRHPPAYFRGWARNEPPRWGQHWGNEWEHQRSGWDRWDRNSAPSPAPLPIYQRQYSGNRYPRAEQQPVIHDQNYRYQARDAEVRKQYQQHEQPQSQDRAREQQAQQQQQQKNQQQSQDRAREQQAQQQQQQKNQQQSQDRAREQQAQQQQQQKNRQQSQDRAREQQAQQQQQQKNQQKSQDRAREQQTQQQRPQQQQASPGQNQGAQQDPGAAKANGKSKPKAKDHEGEQAPDQGAPH